MTPEELAKQLREKVAALKEVAFTYRSDHVALPVASADAIVAALESQAKEVAELQAEVVRLNQLANCEPVISPHMEIGPNGSQRCYGCNQWVYSYPCVYCGHTAALSEVKHGK